MALTRGITHKSQQIDLCAGAKKDLEIWVNFLQSFNGSRMILANEWLSSDVIELYTDAAKSIGFGAYYSGHWFNGTWDMAGVKGDYSIAYLELFPIVLAMLTWAEKLANCKINFHCDNMSVVSIINRQSSKCPHIMILLRKLVLVCLKQNIIFKSSHIEGIRNNITDALSRNQLERFAAIAQEADPMPTTIAQWLPLH